MKNHMMAVFCISLFLMSTYFSVGAVGNDKGQSMILAQCSQTPCGGQYQSKNQSRGQGPMMKNNEQSGRMFGWQLMSEEERLQHREKMRNAKTLEEREQYRMEHRQEMLKRAKEKGIELPSNSEQQ